MIICSVFAYAAQLCSLFVLDIRCDLPQTSTSFKDRLMETSSVANIILLCDHWRYRLVSPGLYLTGGLTPRKRYLTPQKVQPPCPL